MNISDFFSRHERVMLQFSAGKDSAACLYLLEPFWERLTVSWMNPGNQTKEVAAYMQRIKALVPHFQEIKGNQPEWIKIHGYPVDVLPFESTDLGRIADSSSTRRFSSTKDCCAANMWIPMAEAIISGDYTGVIRGQKQCDHLKGPVRSGDVYNGVEYFFPIDDWTDEQVFEFLGPNVPASYQRGLQSSIDCRNCTAYAKEHQGLWEDLQETEPEAAAEIKAVYQDLSSQLENYIAILKRC